MDGIDKPVRWSPKQRSALINLRARWRERSETELANDRDWQVDVKRAAFARWLIARGIVTDSPGGKHPCTNWTDFTQKLKQQDDALSAEKQLFKDVQHSFHA